MERCGEVIFTDVPQNPFQLTLGGLTGHVEASQVTLDPQEQETVCWCQVRTLGALFHHVDVPILQERLDIEGHVDWGIVPLQEPLVCSHFQPLLLEHLQEPLKNINDIVTIHRFPLWNDAVADHPTLSRNTMITCFF